MGIIGIGTVVIDHVVVLDSYPVEDTKTSIQSHWQQIGGPVPVALSVASYYGAKTHFMGRWGDDADGQAIRLGLTERGIDLSPSTSSGDWSTGFAQVWSDHATGSRTIAFDRGSFPNLTAEDIARHAGLFENCDLLHLDGTMPEAAIEAITRVRRCGGIVVVDAGSKKPGMDRLLPLVDVIIASDLFCKSWFGDADVPVEELLRLGPKSAVRTLAERGATFTDGKETQFCPALDIEPVDTNGAGDIFTGAYLHGMLKNWRPAKRLEFANFVAGQACKYCGNSTYPSLAEFSAKQND